MQPNRVMCFDRFGQPVGKQGGRRESRRPPPSYLPSGAGRVSPAASR